MLQLGVGRQVWGTTCCLPKEYVEIGRFEPTFAKKEPLSVREYLSVCEGRKSEDAFDTDKCLYVALAPFGAALDFFFHVSTEDKTHEILFLIFLLCPN